MWSIKSRKYNCTYIWLQIAAILIVGCELIAHNVILNLSVRWVMSGWVMTGWLMFGNQNKRILHSTQHWHWVNSISILKKHKQIFIKYIYVVKLFFLSLFMFRHHNRQLLNLLLCLSGLNAERKSIQAKVNLIEKGYLMISWDTIKCVDVYCQLASIAYR